MDVLNDLKDQTINQWVEYQEKLAQGKQVSSAAIKNNITLISSAEGVSNSRKLFDCLTGYDNEYIEQSEESEPCCKTTWDKLGDMSSKLEETFCNAIVSKSYLDTPITSCDTETAATDGHSGFGCMNAYIEKVLENKLKKISECLEDSEKCAENTCDGDTDNTFNYLSKLTEVASPKTNMADLIGFQFSDDFANEDDMTTQNTDSDGNLVRTEFDGVPDHSIEVEGRVFNSVDTVLEWLIAQQRYKDWDLSVIANPSTIKPYTKTSVKLTITVTKGTRPYITGSPSYTSSTWSYNDFATLVANGGSKTISAEVLLKPTSTKSVAATASATFKYTGKDSNQKTLTKSVSVTSALSNYYAYAKSSSNITDSKNESEVTSFTLGSPFKVPGDGWLLLYTFEKPTRILQSGFNQTKSLESKGTVNIVIGEEKQNISYQLYMIQLPNASEITVS